MHMAETREKARENVQHGLDRFCDYFRDVATFPIVPGDIADRYQYMIDSGSACIGTPDDAIAFIERLQKGSGGFGAILELAHNWADWARNEAALRTDGALRPSALPGVAAMADRQLRLCPRPPRAVHSGVRRGGAGGDRPAGGEAAGGRIDHDPPGSGRDPQPALISILGQLPDY